MGPKLNTNVMGFLIDDAEPVPMPRGIGGGGQGFVDILTSLKTTRRLNNLVYTMTSGRDRIVIRAFRHLVVRLPAGGYGTTEFGMSDQRRDILVEAGRNAMKKYLRRLSPSRGPSRGPSPASSSASQESLPAEDVKEEANEMALSLLRR